MKIEYLNGYMIFQIR